MSWCSCGLLIASGVGDGFVITPEGKILWMRRRSDTFSCTDCGRTYGLMELAAVSGQPILANPPEEAATS